MNILIDHLAYSDYTWATRKLPPSLGARADAAADSDPYDRGTTSMPLFSF